MSFKLKCSNVSVAVTFHDHRVKAFDSLLRMNVKAITAHAKIEIRCVMVAFALILVLNLSSTPGKASVKSLGASLMPNWGQMNTLNMRYVDPALPVACRDGIANPQCPQ